jgi:hypothetical protein
MVSLPGRTTPSSSWDARVLRGLMLLNHQERPGLTEPTYRFSTRDL